MKSASNQRQRRHPSARRGGTPELTAEATPVEAADLYAAFSNAAKPLRAWEDLSDTARLRWEAVAESVRSTP